MEPPPRYLLNPSSQLSIPFSGCIVLVIKGDSSIRTHQPERNKSPLSSVPLTSPFRYELGTEGDSMETARQKLSKVLPRFHCMLTTYEVRGAPSNVFVPS